jgi:hypothetical protein
MNKHSLRFSALLVAAAGLLALPVPQASALEMRHWLKIDGTMFEAEFVRQVGEKVQLRDKDGRNVELLKTQLSFGDLDYIAENAPPDKTIKSLGSSGPKPKLPNPAREVKVDRKTFKKEAGDFKINSRTYRVCETPHFKIMYMKPTDPLDIGELAERLWVDTAFFHSTFIGKWTDRKMGIILVNDDEAYEDIGSWYADMIAGIGTDPAKDSAERIRKTWPKSASGSVNMPQAQADEQNIFSNLRVFRTFRSLVDSTGKVVKKEPVKGVWVPFNTHCLAGDLLDVQAGGTSGATPEGSFAIFTGHSYYKEIQLNGKSETSKLHTAGTGKDVGSAGGFNSDKDWAGELKKLLRKKEGPWKPDLATLFRIKDNDARQADMVFAYAFSRFLQSTPERLTAYNKLCQKIDTANQVPDLAEIAALYGYESAEALQKAWEEWMDSSDFK